MTARTHDAFAFASLVTVAAYYPPESLNIFTLFAAIVGNVVGSLIPDMDDGGNRLWKLLPQGQKLGKTLRRLFYKHRTFSHSLLGMVILYKFLQWSLHRFLNPEFIDPSIVLVSIMVGYISHVIADCMTKEGLPLLYPFKFAFGIPPVKSLRIRTGSWFENFVFLPSIGLYLVWFIHSHQENILHILGLVLA
jgi:inner membrane protein